MTTLQDLFDRMYSRIEATGRCTNEYGNCAYRGRGGSACAVGALIPDEHYSEAIEGQVIDVSTSIVDGAWAPVDGLARCSEGAKAFADALNASGIPATDDVRDLLIDAQSAHDSAYSNEDALKLLRGVAAEHGLTVPTKGA